MDERMRSEAVAAARQLLQRFRAEHPEWVDDKTPVDELVAWCGLEVGTFHPEDQPQGTYGWLEPGEDLIWLCRGLPETLRRFTLAHELGHVVLHRHLRGDEQEGDRTDGPLQESLGDEHCQVVDVQEDVTGLLEQELIEEILGIGQSYDPRSQRELAANIFAAELLMPLERLLTLYLMSHIPPARLAGVFGVSSAAMLNRLAGLLSEGVSESGPRRADKSAVGAMNRPVRGDGMDKIDQVADESAVGAMNRPVRGDGMDKIDQVADELAVGAMNRPVRGGPVDRIDQAADESAVGTMNRPVRGDGMDKNDQVADKSGSYNRPALVDEAGTINQVRTGGKEYDEFQRAAFEAATPALIVAGPGSGKTSTLIGRAEYVIRTLGVAPQHVLALTFSRKAAQEMLERLQLALSDRGDVLPTVSTFHAFCADLLRTHGARVGLRSDFTLVDDAEGYFMLRRLAGELKLRHYQHLQVPTFYFPDILQAISRAKDELITPEAYEQMARRMFEQARDDEERQKAEKALEVAAIYARYQVALRERGDSDFGGLIMLATQLLQGYPEVLDEQQRYQHILVDEFQDMNRASGVLLRLLAGEERRVWVVGDADQAIYRFRGASPANIGNFKDDYAGATVLPLNRNYRSRPDIVLVADAFRGQRMAAEVQEGARQTARSTQIDTYVTLATAADEASEMAGLAAHMRYQKEHGGYSYRDMVVLCRTRAQARKVSLALTQDGLPVVARGGGSLLEQEHVRDLLSMVLLLARPGGMGLLRVARQGEHALIAGDCEALLLAAREQHTTPEALIVYGEFPATVSAEGYRSLKRLREILLQLGRMPDMWSMLAQYVFIETGIMRDVLREAEDAQARQVRADYASVLQLARQFDRQQRKEVEQGEQSVPATIQEQTREFLDYLHVMLTLRQDGAGRQQGGENEHGDGPDSIRVLTVHASKGLEFPIVYLPVLVQRRFPLQARSSPIAAPAGMLAEGEASHESGEACLFYVGVTRARDQLVLSYAERYGKQKYKPSPFLDALVGGLPDERVRRLRWEARIEEARADKSAVGAINRPLHANGAGAIDGGYQPGEGFVEAMKPGKVSAAAIETYQLCPRRYMYGSIYGFQREESGYQLFWQATQKVLEALQKSLQTTEGQDRAGEAGVQWQTQEEVEELYTQHWQALGGQELPFAQVYEQHGREIVRSIYARLVAGKDVSWELRRGFEVEVAGTMVHVEVDRVERPAQEGQPVRFVRNRVGKSKEKPTAQVRELLYAQAFRQLYPGRSIEVHHHNLSTGELMSIKLTEKREQKLYDELEQAIRGIERHEYPARPDAFVCPTCPFYLICPV